MTARAIKIDIETELAAIKAGQCGGGVVLVQLTRIARLVMSLGRMYLWHIMKSVVLCIPLTYSIGVQFAGRQIAERNKRGDRHEG